MSSEVLRKALEILGPNGEHWTQKLYRANDCYCSLGAIAEATWGDDAWDSDGMGVNVTPLNVDSARELPDLKAVRYLGLAIRSEWPYLRYHEHPEDAVVELNDGKGWEEVQRAFERAIELADAE